MNMEEFDLITTYACLCYLLWTIQLENGIFRFLIDVREDKKETKNIVTNAFLGMIFQLVYFL